MTCLKNVDSMSEISTTKKEDIEGFITDWMTETKVPGLSIGIVKDQNIIYSDGFGSKDLKNNSPATAETMYGIGSCTKSFTALAILQMVEKNKLDLNDHIQDHLPIKWEKNISVHHLLTHSSSMPSLGIAEALIDRLIEMDERGVPMGDWGDFYIHLNQAEKEMTNKLGEDFFYFNSGYDLLGLLIEEINGVKYAKYVQENILNPLEMDRSTFKYETNDNFMKPYFIREEGPESTPYPDGEIGYASGGLISNVLELCNYLKMNMDEGVFNGKKIIDKELLRKAHTGFIESRIGEYGYGWAVNDFLGEELIGHGGSIGVASGYIGFMDDLGVAILSNTSPSFSMEEIGKAILAIMRGKEALKLPFFARKEKMDMLTGEYRSYKGIKRAEIEIDCGLLKLTFKERLEENSLILIPSSKHLKDHEFYYLDGRGNKNTVKFDVKSENEIDLYIDRWRLHKNRSF